MTDDEQFYERDPSPRGRKWDLAAVMWVSGFLVGFGFHDRILQWWSAL